MTCSALFFSMIWTIYVILWQACAAHGVTKRWLVASGSFGFGNNIEISTHLCFHIICSKIVSLFCIFSKRTHTFFSDLNVFCIFCFLYLGFLTYLKLRLFWVCVSFISAVGSLTQNGDQSELFQMQLSQMQFLFQVYLC